MMILKKIIDDGVYVLIFLLVLVSLLFLLANAESQYYGRYVSVFSEVFAPSILILAIRFNR